MFLFVYLFKYDSSSSDGGGGGGEGWEQMERREGKGRGDRVRYLYCTVLEYSTGIILGQEGMQVIPFIHARISPPFAAQYVRVLP